MLSEYIHMIVGSTDICILYMGLLRHRALKQSTPSHSAIKCRVSIWTQAIWLQSPWDHLRCLPIRTSIGTNFASQVCLWPILYALAVNCKPLYCIQRPNNTNYSVFHPLNPKGWKFLKCPDPSANVLSNVFSFEGYYILSYFKQFLVMGIVAPG